ncbi:MAG: hypothetical protein ABIR17_08425 [Pseudolysinimonas sp.]|uniref:hypothetical protein n=1 Tax=Pseudolysinimonas sp. TaxID=2680009 RepID=UPI003265645A
MIPLRFVGFGLAGLLVIGVAAGAVAGSVTRTQTCVSWVSYADEAAMAKDSDVVVEGVVGAVTGKVDLLGGPGDGHVFEVSAVRQGVLDATTITVVSPRDWCTANPPQPADPLREGDRVVLYLRDLPTSDAWSTLTPFQGVIPLDSSG